MASRPYIDIMFGEFLPDLAGAPDRSIPGYLVSATGVRLTPLGYRQIPKFVTVTSATAIGGSAITYGNGASFYRGNTTYFFYVHGVDGTIYESRAEGTDTWENVSASGTLDPFGDFFRFGDDVVYVCASRAPIVKDLTASHATDFAALSGSPPTGATGARVHQHAVIGGGSSTPYTVRTSAIGNHEDWPTAGTADARSKQAISETLNPAFGPVKRILPGEKFGIILQDSALTRMTYVGGASVYEFATYEQIDGGGTRIDGRPVTDGRLWYFRTDSGVLATDGFSVRSLSAGKIDESLTGAVVPNYTIARAFTSAYDRDTGLIIFGERDNSGATRHQMAMNVDDGSFCFLNEDGETGMFVGFTFPSSDVSGPVHRPHVYNVNTSDNKLQKLEAASGAIVMQTGYIEIDPGYRVQFHGAHLLGNGTSGLTLAYKAAATESACDTVQTGFTSLTAASLGQKKTARANSQYLAFRVTGNALSSLIRGIRVYYERAEASP